MIADIPDAPPGGALAGLGRVAYRGGEQVGMVPVGLDLIVRSAADHVADGDDELDEDRDRVGLALWLDGPDHLADDAVICRLAHGRPLRCFGVGFLLWAHEASSTPPEIALPPPTAQ